jgi:hypothetical protein
LKGFCRLFPRKKHEESDKKFEVILKILRKKQKLKGFLKGFCRLLRRKKQMNKATKSLENHFKNFKKEKQKLKGFCRLLKRKKHMKKATRWMRSHFKDFKDLGSYSV